MQSQDRDFWIRLTLGLVAVWALFQAIAQHLGSMRGEAGLLVAAAVTAALFCAERLLFRTPPSRAWRSLGFAAPGARAMACAVGVCALLLLYFPIYAALTGRPLRALAGWEALALGQFMQGGVAEEALFRGFLFRHVRERHSFWRAAWLSMAPFALVHLMLFATLPIEIALVSFVLSIVIAFPLARLFELGGGSLWAPALVHATIQGMKLVDPSTVDGASFGIGWMLASAAVPWLVFLVEVPQHRPRRKAD